MSTSTIWHLERDRARLQTDHGTWSLDIERLANGLMFDAPMGLGDPGTVSVAETDRDRLLGVQVPGFPDRLPAAWIVDRYVRCNDLITTYERPHPDHLRVQVYWRYLHRPDESLCAEASNVSAQHGSIAGIHLIVSLQTDRLDRHPSVCVVSQLSGDQLRCLHMDELSDAIAEAQANEQAGRVSATEGDGSGAVAPCESLVHPGRSQDAPVWIVRQDAIERSTVLMTLPADLTKVALHRSETGWRHEFHLLDEHLEKGVIRRAQVVAWWVPRAGDEEWARARFARWCAEPPPLTT